MLHVDLAVSNSVTKPVFFCIFTRFRSLCPLPVVAQRGEESSIEGFIRRCVRTKSRLSLST